MNELTESKSKMKKVVAKVEMVWIYHAETVCPYCKANNSMDVEDENVTVIQKCWSCNGKYKVKIPKNSFY